MNLFRRLKSRLIWHLLPPRCLICEQAGLAELDLCGHCVAQLPWLKFACARCAMPTPRPTAYCGRCIGQALRLQRSKAVFEYAFPVSKLLARFKYQGSLAAGSVLWTLALRKAAQASIATGSALLPVPIHRSRLRSRGFNQSLLIARSLSRHWQRPLCERLLCRSRATAPQNGLSAAERRRNLRGAFSLSPGVAVPPRITLIDDVMTTGSTANACAEVLLRAGAERVDLWVLARASLD